MCSSKSKQQRGIDDISPQVISHINGRPVFQPYSNRDPLLERHNSLKNSPSKTSPTATTHTYVKNNNSIVKHKISATTPPISPKIKRVGDSNMLNIINTQKIVTPKSNAKSTKYVKNSSSFKILEVPGSIAAARREQVAMMQVQRKMKTAHYGRTNSAKYENRVIPLDSSNSSSPSEGKRCSFITPNSEAVYIAYHDEEWGVPVHDDNLLFELLVLTVAQVGSDWTSVLKKRQYFREALSGFDPEIVAKYNEKKINSTSADYGIELSQVRGVIDNSKRILEMKKQFGSFDKYLWGFVNNKPIATQYKACNKIPVKTSKSETMSKDMVKRGFRYVGPSIIHSFMQAAGLTNDHLITCPGHLQCATLAITSENILSNL